MAAATKCGNIVFANLLGAQSKQELHMGAQDDGNGENEKAAPNNAAYHRVIDHSYSLIASILLRTRYND